jgi:hypothetical protein
VRMVDVETGDEPRPMRTLDEEPAERPLDPPQSEVGNGRAVKRPSSTPASAEIPRRPQPDGFVQQQPRSAPAPSSIAGPRWSAAGLDTGKLLWLGNPSGDPFAEPGDGSARIAPWRRGLRG